MKVKRTEVEKLELKKFEDSELVRVKNVEE